MGYVADRVAEVLAQHGEAMTLRRPLTTSTFRDVAVFAKRFEGEGAPGRHLADQRAQSAVRFKISDREIAADGWPGPPRAGDKLVASDATWTLVKDADTRRAGDQIVMHILLAEGEAL